MKKSMLALAVSAAFLPVLAQESPSFKLTEHAFNAGGHPETGIVMVSPSFKVSLDSIGDAVVKTGLSGPSFRLDAGFASAFPPPGEVLGLGFTDHATMYWNPERSAGTYNLYRGLLSDLSGLGYGTCLEHHIPGSGTTDPSVPSASDGFYYLVTAENRLDEEGSKGYGDTAPRPNPSPCP